MTVTTLSLRAHVLVLAAAATLASAVREITIVNRCPSPLNVYINGKWNHWLRNGGSAVSPFSNDFSGFIYTDANGGSQSGAECVYYLVTDPKGFNVGMSIEPSINGVASTRHNSRPSPPHDNQFCSPATCSSLGCPTAFTFPPTRFPPLSHKAPNPPLYVCPQRTNNAGYIVTFCPSGRFPHPPWNPSVMQGLAIHPDHDNTKCLDVRGAVLENGIPVQIYDCDGTGAQKWIFTKGHTQVRVAGTNFCLDAGSNPANGVHMKIWTCYDQLAAQHWYYSNNQIALANRGQCLDLTSGNPANGNEVQTRQCHSGNRNQIWTV
ncbi:G-X-X-X-Q-X-W domain-containing protein [Lyophyllum atratum]|nr:G-X-X-X-Q-X-W domain-containing protein [Lyophyllum atratum]